MKFKQVKNIDRNTYTPGDNRLVSDVLIAPSVEIARKYRPRKVKPEIKPGRVKRKMPLGGLIETDLRPSAEKRPKDRPLRGSIFVPPEQMAPPWRIPEELHRIREAYGLSLRAMARMLGITWRRLADLSALDVEGIPVSWLDADVALRIERLTGVSALDLLAIDAATRIWVLNRTDIHRQMLNLLPVLPTIARRRQPKDQTDAAHPDPTAQS